MGTKLTALTEITTLVTTDILYVVSDPGGTPVSKKITVANLLAGGTVSGNLTLTGDLAVNGGDLTSTATTFNLLNATVTTLNVGGAATVIALGAASTVITLGSNATINGGAAANDDLTLQGTSHATRTTSYVILQPTDGNVGIGTTGPSYKLHLVGGETYLDGTGGSDIPLTVYKSISSNSHYAGLSIITHPSSGTYGAADITFSLTPYTSTYADVTEYQAKTVLQTGTAAFVANDASGELQFYTGGRAAGNRRVTIKSDGNVGIGTTGPDRLFHSELADAVTNAVSYVARLTHITSGTPANSIGVGLEFEQETAADNNEVIATITAVVTDVTAAAEDAALVFSTMVAGAAATEGMRLTGNTLALGAGNLTLTGTISATGARVTQSYHTNITSTNAVTVDSSLRSKVPESIFDYAGDALAVIGGMRVVSYRHHDYLDASNRVKLGVIAETVNEPLVLQEIENPNGGVYPGVNLMGLTALNSRGIQQLHERISRLERVLLAAGIASEMVQ